MNKIACAASFVVGAAIGSVATWFFVKTKYEQIAKAEIESVKEVFTFRKPDGEDSPSECKKEERVHVAAIKEKPDLREYVEKVRELGYFDKDEEDEEPPEECEPFDESRKEASPYIISENEFGEFDDYETITLTYHSDKVLADDDGERVEDIKNVVGYDALNQFGDDDCIHVRNDRLKIDYEILLDNESYIDYLKKFPYKGARWEELE